VLQRQVANGSVYSAGNIEEKRRIAKGVVAESINVVKQREAAKSTVELTAVVKYHGVYSDRRVFRAGGVQQKRRSASGCVGIGIVQDQRRAKSRIEAAGCINKERPPTKR